MGFSKIEKLKSPELVASIQHYFGVKNINSLQNNSECSKTKGEKHDFKGYIVTNKFWYWLFIIGTGLGDEAFYALFIPFWFWNIDGAVGRRVVLVWGIVMYIGQGIKDIVQWPRPGAPVFRLHNKWALEYGMPSTHAMVGVSIPFSVILYTMNRYLYNLPFSILFAVCWCTIICLSRLYLGMHTVLDIIVGLLLTILLMIPLVPLVDHLDHYLMTNTTSPFLLLVSSIVIIVYYPNSGKWTPTRGDTTMVLSVCVGILTGSWLNYQTGELTPSDLKPPYPIMWPSSIMFGCLILRSILGFTCIGLLKALSENIFYSCMCALLRQDEANLKQSEHSLENKHKTIVELATKYLTCSFIGFCITYSLPQLFKYLRIERPNFFTEI
ncbi:sphingosine-1-phosphate phosphatase 1-like [Coccinella septempunctata]|uniref:sphingosine-1-phosphate phosphatase 1-like n=1 Tax=Coccinella septempunctata TaxID=41139 RepID=UPI001D082224|nr:sphingosine-1-phosphate phosphatase 1-like [Coccinella septempunctata]